jgi:SAM-dependent methyltransferase
MRGTLRPPGSATQIAKAGARRDIKHRKRENGTLAMTTAARSHIANTVTVHGACLICRGQLSKIADNLYAASSRADTLYPLALFECTNCGHVQKDVGKSYQAHMDDVYRVSYSLPGGGKKNNVINGKVISRETALAKTLAGLLDRQTEGAVLDIGTGTGHLLAAFSEELPEFDIVGYDLNNDKEDLVRANGATDFYFGSLEDIPKQFDIITFNHVLEHLPDPVTILKQASALLKPDGYMAVIVPCFKAVYTDFFFLEHCSHFTAKSLNVVSALAGLSILNRLEGVLGLVEIGFVSQRSEKHQSVTPIEAIQWAKSLPEFIRGHGKQKQVGIFGVNGAGMWLGTVLKGQLSFYVDDDPAKQGTTFAECPIVSVSEIPEDSVVIVAFNNPEASYKMCERLKQARPEINFIAPPMMPRPMSN